LCSFTFGNKIKTLLRIKMTIGRYQRINCPVLIIGAALAVITKESAVCTE